MARSEISSNTAGSTWVSLLATIICAGLMIFGSWPGWLSKDSEEMRAEAISGVFTDWHSPVLSWFWRYLAPSQSEIHFPFILQQLVFWVGIGLVVYVVSKILGLWATVLPISVLLLDHSWVTSWLWKDATAVCLAALCLGFWAASLLISKDRLSYLACASALLCLGAISVARWYLIPSLVLGATAMILSYREHTKRQNAIAYAGLIGAFIFTSVLTPALAIYALQPQPSYHSASIKYLDLWRASCLTLEARNSPHKFPAQLVNTQTRPICEEFNPLVWNVLNESWQSSESMLTTIRLPQNAAESTDVQQAWTNVLTEDPLVLAYSRALTLRALMGPSDSWVVEGGGQAGFARLDIAQLPADVLLGTDDTRAALNSAALYVVVFPTIFSVIAFRKLGVRGAWPYLGLWFPFAWVVNIVLLAPAVDTRYIAPAVTWAIAYPFLLFAFKSGHVQRYRPDVAPFRRAGGI